MCDPVTLTTAFAVATSAAGVAGQYITAKKQTKALNAQNQQQADELSTAAGIEMTERARAARRERASMRAAGAASGINLDTSGDFLASLQTSAINQFNDQGLIGYNEKTRQKARDSEYRSALSRIEMPSALSAALTIGSTYIGASGAAKGRATTASKKAAGSN